MKIFVTGGMGFIGSNFIRYFYYKYPTSVIVNFDALTYAGNPENLADIEAADAGGGARRYTFVHGDIADAPAVLVAMKKYQPDCIINFAAESHVDRSLVDSDQFIRSNIVGVQNLLQFSRRCGIKFLHISTDEIYGDVPEGYSTEESPLRPSNPYAASKAAADILVQAYIKTHKPPVLMIRGSNNFGKYQYPEKLIPLAITNIIEEKKIPVHGNGQHIRTWIHVEDFIDGIDSVLHNAPDGSIYNIVGYEESNIGVLKCIATYLCVSPSEILEYVGDRPAADIRYAPHAGKIERELGWVPKRHLNEELPKIIDWYKENRSWWAKIKEKNEFKDHYDKQSKAKWY